MFVPYFPPRPQRLIARRRSRCWQCDGQMTKRRGSWWCAKCKHLVTYLSKSDNPT